MARIFYLLIIFSIIFSSSAFAIQGNQANDFPNNDQLTDEEINHGITGDSNTIEGSKFGSTDNSNNNEKLIFNSTGGNNSYLAIQLFFSLILVLVLIYLFFWLIKKKSNFSDSRLYNHLGGLPLGQNKSIQIVEIGNKIYVLGVGEDVQLINILESNEDMDAIRDSINIYGNINNRFNGWLKGKFSKRNNVNVEGQFEKELAEKIEQIKEKRSQSFTDWLDGNEKGK